MQSADQPSALHLYCGQSVVVEKKELSVHAPARTWICPVSARPASLAASVLPAR